MKSTPLESVNNIDAYCEMILSNEVKISKIQNIGAKEMVVDFTALLGVFCFIVIFVVSFKRYWKKALIFFVVSYIDILIIYKGL